MAPLTHLSLYVTSHTVDHSTVGGLIPSGAMLLWHAVAAMAAITFSDFVHTVRTAASEVNGRRKVSP
ncbi:MAG: hypothetical protein ACKVKB_04545 [Candidatus Nanopelagicales bacterium]